MKCPSCNKFAGLDLSEPEIQTEDFDGDSGAISAEVRLVRTSQCCGDEMKEYVFQIEGELPNEILGKHQGEGHKLSAEFSADTTEEGGGRYQKSYFGVNLEVSITCQCQKEPIWTHTFDDKVAASAMEELA